MGARILVILGLALPLGMAQAFAQPVTSAPDAEYGKKLAGNLCSNCHLVGTGEQQQANADIPSFHEIANKEGQTAGSIMAHIVLSTRCPPSR
jgi:cytochrome c2